MDRLIYYETEEDYKNNNYVAECSIVQYTYNKKKNKLLFKKDVNGSVLYFEGMDEDMLIVMVVILIIMVVVSQIFLWSI